MLRELKLESVPARAGGLDREQDWEPLLSLSEQQLLACLHVLLAAPRFAFLDRPDTALSREQVNQILQLFSDDKIGYLTIGEPDESLDFYDAILEIADDGGWKWRAIKAGKIIAE